MDEHFLQNKPYIEDFWDKPLHNVLCQISAPKKIFVCTAGIFYCSDESMIIFWMQEKYTSATQAKQLSCN